MMSQTVIPRLRSKYIPEVIIMDSNDESEDDDDFVESLLTSSSSKATPSSLTLGMSFVVDTNPSLDSQAVETKDEVKLASSLDPGKDLSGYIPKRAKDIQKLMNQHSEADKIYQDKCVLHKEGFMTAETIAPKILGPRIAKRLRKLEREKTAGNNWYNLPAQEITPEIEADIKLINMRDGLDPKRHYKRNSGVDKLKYFQFGTIVGPQADYFNDLTRRQKKRTLVEELMTDMKARAWQRKKFSEIVSTNPQYLRIKKHLENKKKKRKEEEAGQGGQSDNTTYQSVKRHYKRKKVEKVNLFNRSKAVVKKKKSK